MEFHTIENALPQDKIPGPWHYCCIITCFLLFVYVGNVFLAIRGGNML